MGKLVVVVNFCKAISSFCIAKLPQTDLNCQKKLVFVVCGKISVQFPKDFAVNSNTINLTTKKELSIRFFEENIAVFCFKDTAE